MISVIMTTYNCASYIQEAVQSMLNQTYKNLELLIIDDGSLDNTEKEVRKFADSRIRYFKQSHLGRSASLNFGLEKAKYEMISIMDADDIAHPLRLEMQINRFSGNENEICFTDAAYFTRNKIKYTSRNELNSKDLNKVLALHGYFTNSTFMFNKNFIVKNGGYNSLINIGEDYELWLRIKDKSKFILINEVLQYVRIRKNSITQIDNNVFCKAIYNIQLPYYEDLNRFFNISLIKEQNIIKGWREWFYGSKKLSRIYWNKIKLSEWGFRMFIAYLLSFLPIDLFDKFKNQKIALKIKFFLKEKFNLLKLNKEFNKVLGMLIIK